MLGQAVMGARRCAASMLKWHMPSKCAACDFQTPLFNGPYCQDCSFRITKLRSLGIALVFKAVRLGIIPRASTLTCVDCARPAREYDHRDYFKPLEVQPVCSRCNLKRGPANTRWEWKPYLPHRTRLGNQWPKMDEIPVPQSLRDALCAAGSRHAA